MEKVKKVTTNKRHDKEHGFIVINRKIATRGSEFLNEWRYEEHQCIIIYLLLQFILSFIYLFIKIHSRKQLWSLQTSVRFRESYDAIPLFLYFETSHTA